MLQDDGATVICCNSKTQNLKKWTLLADVIITAVGKHNLINSNMVKPNQVIIDIGIDIDENGKLCGDCNKSIYDKVDLITSVPNGVGLITRTNLLENLIYGV